jgi:hypothetical protein
MAAHIARKRPGIPAECLILATLQPRQAFGPGLAAEGFACYVKPALPALPLALSNQHGLAAPVSAPP